MKKYTNSVFLALILMTAITIAPSFVSAQENGGDDSVGITPTTSSTTNGGDDSVVTTSSTTNGSDDTVASTQSPTTSSTTNGGDDSIVTTSSTTNGSDDTVASTPTTPTTPSTTSGSRGGGGGGSRRTNSTTTLGTTLPILTNIGDCSYLTDYMRIGGNNNTAEVTKLQTFLKNTEKFDVEVNGTFDQKTLDAVLSFQAKYVEEIMAPWGVNTPTGQVFYTTKNKINEIVCKANFNLTAEQIAQIEAYRKGIQDGSLDASASSTDSLSPEVGSVGNSQEAALSGVSITDRVWGFIKWLFGY